MLCSASNELHNGARMTINLELKHAAARLMVGLLALAASGLLVMIVFSRFIIGTLSDERFMLDREWLLAGIHYLPDSPRLNARLAEIELFAADPDLTRADRAAARAVELSPVDYRWRLILASVKEAEGDRAAAEVALRDARRLAPNDRDVHYRLANVLLREGKLAPAIDEFHVAMDKNRQPCPGRCVLFWPAPRATSNPSGPLPANNPGTALHL